MCHHNESYSIRSRLSYCYQFVINMWFVATVEGRLHPMDEEILIKL